jgi:Domain of unknown function (DUF4166)
MEPGRLHHDNVIAFRRHATSLPLGDTRFRALLGAGAWAELPDAVRKRFAKRVAGAASVTYTGEVVECQISALGWWLAQMLRLIGAPLPISRDVLTPAVVVVTEDELGGGQFWLRQYGRRSGFPQVIKSAKRFAGPTGLEEHIGCGIGVALTLAVEQGALLFRSDHYFVAIGNRRMRLPRWLSPGALTVGHVDCGEGWFAFTLALDHPLMGKLVRQTALFRDARPD